MITLNNRNVTKKNEASTSVCLLLASYGPEFFCSCPATSRQEDETCKTWCARWVTDVSFKKFKDVLTSLASVMR